MNTEMDFAIVNTGTPFTGALTTDQERRAKMQLLRLEVQEALDNLKEKIKMMELRLQADASLMRLDITRAKEMLSTISSLEVR